MAPADRDQVREAGVARYAGLARAAQAGDMIADGDPDTSEGCAAVYPDAGDLPERGIPAWSDRGDPAARPVSGHDHLQLRDQPVR